MRALSAFPEKFLQKFGQKHLDDSDIVKAEQYLEDQEYTIDEVRYNQIQQQLDVMDLSTTSHSIVHGHILIWWLKMSGLLDEEEFILNPTDFGLEDINWHLYPEKHFNLIPDHLLKTCSRHLTVLLLLFFVVYFCLDII